MHVVNRLCIVALAFAVAGCDSVSHDRLLIRPAAEPASSRQIAAHVRAALLTVASRHGFVERTAEPGASGVVAWFVQPIDNFPIEFGARRVDGVFVVDLKHFHPGARATVDYRRVRAELIRELEANPGTSVSWLEEADPIAVRPSRPVD